jgi:hypothetical protein
VLDLPIAVREPATYPTSKSVHLAPYQPRLLTCGKLLLPGRFRAEAGGLAVAWGVVDVKRVASVADRGIVSTINILERDAIRTIGGGFILTFVRELYIRRFF